MADSPLPLLYPNRFPTITASEALALEKFAAPRIKTGSEVIDRALSGGLARGRVTELCGPPGVGKTAFGLQVAANALLAGHREGNKVVWIDTSDPLPEARLVATLARSRDPQEVLQNLQTIRMPVLEHLQTLIERPSHTFPPENTSLVVIDNVSTPFTAAFPEEMEDRGAVNGSEGGGAGGIVGGDADTVGDDAEEGGCIVEWEEKWDPVRARRLVATENLVSALVKLAGFKDVAVLVLNQTTTRMIPGFGEVLIPSLNSLAWTCHQTSRLLMHYSQTSPSISVDPEPAQIPRIRCVTILKADRSLYNSDEPSLVMLQIEETGVRDVEAVPGTAVPEAGLKALSRMKRCIGLAEDLFPRTEAELLEAEEMYAWEEEAAGDDNETEAASQTLYTQGFPSWSPR